MDKDLRRKNTRNFFKILRTAEVGLDSGELVARLNVARRILTMQDELRHFSLNATGFDSV
jgi:hypothetical protein